MSTLDKTDLVWNRASTTFNTHKDEISEAAADNILIAWPILLSLINESFEDRESLNALDYGCGTGGFAEQLHKLGFKVTGIDYANEMIEKALKHCSKKITFKVGDYKVLNKSEKFSLITSIMVLQFVPDIEELFKIFSQHITFDGILAFAVFNPEWVKKCQGNEEVLFSNYDSSDPKRVKMHIANSTIPVYLRTAEEYETLAKNNNFIKVLESYPLFTSEFLEKYPSTLPADVSEFLILGFKRTS